MATLTEIVQNLQIRGSKVPEKLLGVDYHGSACDCGVCDDGGYCICNDDIPSARAYSPKAYSAKA